MTLFILESGLTQASEVTKEFFKRTEMFFVRKNHNGTISFISATSPDDMLTTSFIKSFSRAQNGYMRIVTQNSVINVPPCVISCLKLPLCQVQDMVGYCPVVKTETLPYKFSWYYGEVIEDARLIVKTKKKFTLISEDNFSQPYRDGDWIDGTDRLFKDEQGYLYLEHTHDLESGASDHSFIKTNIKIG